MAPLTLRFPDRALESDFRAEYARSAIRSARATTILVIVLFAGYVVLDVRSGTLMGGSICSGCEGVRAG